MMKTRTKPLVCNPRSLRVLHVSTPDEMTKLTPENLALHTGMDNLDQLSQLLAHTTYSVELKGHSIEEHLLGPWITARRIWLRGAAKVVTPTGRRVDHRWLNVCLAFVNARWTGPDTHYAKTVAAAQAHVAKLQSVSGDLDQVIELLNTPISLNTLAGSAGPRFMSAAVEKIFKEPLQELEHSAELDHELADRAEQYAGTYRLPAITNGTERQNAYATDIRSAVLTYGICDVLRGRAGLSSSAGSYTPRHFVRGTPEFKDYTERARENPDTRFKDCLESLERLVQIDDYEFWVERSANAGIGLGIPRRCQPGEKGIDLGNAAWTICVLKGWLYAGEDLAKEAATA